MLGRLDRGDHVVEQVPAAGVDGEFVLACEQRLGWLAGEIDVPAVPLAAAIHHHERGDGADLSERQGARADLQGGLHASQHHDATVGDGPGRDGVNRGGKRRGFCTARVRAGTPETGLLSGCGRFSESR